MAVSELLIISVISGTTSINVNWAGWLIFAGIISFSGSLYILVLTQIKVLVRLRQLVAYCSSLDGQC